MWRSTCFSSPLPLLSPPLSWPTAASLHCQICCRRDSQRGWCRLPARTLSSTHPESADEQRGEEDGMRQMCFSLPYSHLNAILHSASCLFVKMFSSGYHLSVFPHLSHPTPLDLKKTHLNHSSVLLITWHLHPLWSIPLQLVPRPQELFQMCWWFQGGTQRTLRDEKIFTRKLYKVVHHPEFLQV